MLAAVKKLTVLYHHRTRSRDGQSVHIDEMIYALRSLGHKVIVVEPQRVEATVEAIESRLLPPLIYEIAEFCYSFIEFAKLALAAIRYSPDVLYERENLFMLSGLWISRLFQLPFLLEVNAPLAEERARYNGLYWKRFAFWTEKVCWRNAFAVLPVTKVLADIIRREGVPSDRIFVTPNGVNLKQFHPRDVNVAKRALGLEGQLVLGFVGYVRDWHGLDRVVDLLASNADMKDAVFLVVGDGPARLAIEQKASNLGILDRVRFTGTMPRETLPQLIAAFDVALQPQVTAYASPLKIFEYMAQAKAIIAPNSDNIREILENQSDALLYNVECEDEFATAIEKMVRDQRLRERLGNAALQKIINRDMSWEGNARRVIALSQSFTK